MCLQLAPKLPKKIFFSKKTTHTLCCKWLHTLRSDMSSLLASLCAHTDNKDRAEHVPAVSGTVHPDVQVLPLHTRDTHHHPLAPLCLPLRGWPHLSGRHFENRICGMFVQANSDFSMDCSNPTVDRMLNKTAFSLKCLHGLNYSTHLPVYTLHSRAQLLMKEPPFTAQHQRISAILKGALHWF